MPKLNVQRYTKPKTVALLHFDESMTKDECGNTWSIVGSPSLSSDTYKFGSSAIFVNKENYIQTNDNFTLGGQDFTIDFWAYFSGEDDCTFFYGSAFDIDYNNEDFNFGFYYSRSGDFHFPFDVRSRTIFSENFNLNLNDWNYIAICYNFSEGKISFYINDKNVKRDLTVGKYFFKVQSLKIGSIYEDYASATGCYIDDFRIIDGVALYSDDFTPPTSPAEKIVRTIPQIEAIQLYSIPPANSVAIGYDEAEKDQFTKILLHFDESATKDECDNAWSSTYLPTISNSKAYFNGSNSYLSLNGGITLGGQDFTFDFWAYPDADTGSWSVIFAIFTNYNTEDGRFLFCTANNSGAVGVYSSLLGSFTAGDLRGQLFHCAIVYQHSLQKTLYFINGTLRKTVELSAQIERTSYPYLLLGKSNYTSDPYYKGYIDNFRFSDGIARWTSDFTPPAPAIFAGIVNENNSLASHIRIFDNGQIKALALKKPSPTLSLSATSVTVNNSSLSQTVTVNSESSGVLSVYNSNSNVATAKISGSTITITGNGIGNATITVKVAETPTFESMSVNIYVNADVAPALSACSPEQIQSIVKTGKAATYWNVGDLTAAIAWSGTLTSSVGTTYTLKTPYYAKIIGFDHNKALETSGKSSIHFALASKSNGADIAFVDSTYWQTTGKKVFYQRNAVTNSGGWNSTNLKLYILPDFYKALPSDWKAVISTVTKYTDNTGNKSTSQANVTATTEQIFIPAAYEVCGSTTNDSGTTFINPYEANKQEQYDYFKNHKIRYKSSDNSTACLWWLRSPASNVAAAFRLVNASGNVGGAANNTEYSLGVVPCFVIS